MITTTKTDAGYLYSCEACGWSQTLPFGDWRNAKCGCAAKRPGGKTATALSRVVGEAKPARPKAPSLNRTDCLNIIEATGDSVEQKNCGCAGNKMTSVWECELFGRVAPFAKGDPGGGVRACQKCSAYEKSLPASPSAE